MGWGWVGVGVGVGVRVRLLVYLEHNGRGTRAHVNLHPAVEGEARAALG